MRGAVLTVAGRELRAALRGRLIASFGALFALLAVGIALAGLGGSGRVLVQDFTRTAASLLNLSIYLFPLLGLVLGAAAFSGGGGDLELLVAQPIKRSTVLVGRLLGLLGAVSAVAFAGFGAAGLLVALRVGTAGLGSYALVAGASLLTAATGLGIGALLGILLRGGSAAVGWALAVWLYFAVLFDLALIGALQVLGDARPGLGVAAALALNPVDALRAIALVRLDAELLLGPAGATLFGVYGRGAGFAVLAVATMVWLVAPAALAGVLFSRRDL
ncbi:MAG TPA: ABC transporter permease subunit [Longimicrobiales bacterium]|nr:ABC transporter permease subunit [Longimicrobiales bacterium]